MQSRWQGRSPPCGDLPAPWYAPTAAQTSEPPTLILSRKSGIASVSSATPTALPVLRARVSAAAPLLCITPGQFLRHLRRFRCPVAHAFMRAASTLVSTLGGIPHWLRLRRSVGQPVLAAAGFQPARPVRQFAPRPKEPPEGGCGQNCPPHSGGRNALSLHRGKGH